MPASPELPPFCPFEKRFPSQLVRDDAFFMSLAYNQAIEAWREDEVPIGAVIEIEGEVFGSGELLLESETKPLLPAGFKALGEMEALVTLHEGRYHQVRRMFAAVENHVVSLKRISIGGLKLPEELAEGEWRVVSNEERALLFAKD